MEWVSPRALHAQNDILIAPVGFEPPKIDRGKLIIGIDDENPRFGRMRDRIDYSLLVSFSLIAHEQMEGSSLAKRSSTTFVSSVLASSATIISKSATRLSHSAK